MKRDGTGAVDLGPAAKQIVVDGTKRVLDRLYRCAVAGRNGQPAQLASDLQVTSLAVTSTHVYYVGTNSAMVGVAK